MGDKPVDTIKVPASLDLVERARLGLNGLAGSVNPDLDYEPYFLTLLGARPAYRVHWSSMVSGVMPKYVEAFTLLIPFMNARQYRGVARASYIFKGSTCIGSVEDENIFGSEVAWVRLYRRPQYHLEEAPLVEVPYRVVEDPIQWYKEF
jgi:hypothetical protein